MSSSQRTNKQKFHHAELASTVSTLYAKLLVVVGVAVPVTASVGQKVPAAFEQVSRSNGDLQICNNNNNNTPHHAPPPSPQLLASLCALATI